MMGHKHTNYKTLFKCIPVRNTSKALKDTTMTFDIVKRMKKFKCQCEELVARIFVERWTRNGIQMKNKRKMCYVQKIEEWKRLSSSNTKTLRSLFSISYIWT